jgi:hypothetical protein
MHDNIVAGKLTAMRHDDDENRIERGQILDEDEWWKLVAGRRPNRLQTRLDQFIHRFGSTPWTSSSASSPSGH